MSRGWKTFYLCAVAAAIAIILFAILSGAQAATPRCAPYDDMEKVLGMQYKEKRVAGGFVNENRALALFVADEGKTWTILIVRPDEMSCILAVGQYWDGEFKPPPGEPT
jgi:hypothetical protein